MKELMILMAKLLPEDKMVEEIIEHGKEYLLTKTDESKKHLQMYCHLLLTKDLEKEMGMEQMVKQIGQVERIRERLDSTSEQ